MTCWAVRRTPAHRFSYIIPPGNDDLSAAVVMDSGVRPPPPPAPPGPPGGSCKCPLTPEQTTGGVAGKCNTTYATMKASMETDPAVFYQCVPWPNYGEYSEQRSLKLCEERAPRLEPALLRSALGGHIHIQRRLCATLHMLTQRGAERPPVGVPWAHVSVSQRGQTPSPDLARPDLTLPSCAHCPQTCS